MPVHEKTPVRDFLAVSQPFLLRLLNQLNNSGF